MQGKSHMMARTATTPDSPARCSFSEAGHSALSHQTRTCTPPRNTLNIDFSLENNVHVHCIIKEIHTHYRKHRKYRKMTRNKINCLTFWCISF